jgi:conjugal transfer mating pair stabilization protein TraN
MKTFLLFVAAIICHVSVQAQILPNTVMCIKGSEAHKVSYCGDPSPCKTVVGPNETHTVCVAGTQNPPAGAIMSASTCFSQVTEYTCLQYTSNCAQYIDNKNCTEDGKGECTKNATNDLLLASNPKLGACAAYTRTFECTDPATSATTTTTTSTCNTNTKMGGLDWPTAAPTGGDDLAEAVTDQEFARQLALYGAKDGIMSGLFPGASLGCTDGLGGLKNCCGASGGGAATNSTVLKKVTGQVAFAAFTHAGAYAVRMGSEYVFDTVLSMTPNFMVDGVVGVLDSGMSAGLEAGGLASGFGAMGFGTTAASAGGTFFGAGSSMALGETGLYFNPYALAAAIAIQLVMDAISCSQSEYDLANAKSENLCHYVGNFCSMEMKFLGMTIACLETTQSYCCYNGLLAKAVEEGAHQQLGLSWGSPNSTQCQGLSIDQLKQVDFSTPEMKVAMKPFTDLIMKNFKANVGAGIASGTVKALTQTTATTTGSALCLQRKKYDPTTVCN